MPDSSHTNFSSIQRAQGPARPRTPAKRPEIASALIGPRPSARSRTMSNPSRPSQQRTSPDGIMGYMPKANTTPTPAACVAPAQVLPPSRPQSRSSSTQSIKASPSGPRAPLDRRNRNSTEDSKLSQKSFFEMIAPVAITQTTTIQFHEENLSGELSLSRVCSTPSQATLGPMSRHLRPLPNVPMSAPPNTGRFQTGIYDTAQPAPLLAIPCPNTLPSQHTAPPPEYDSFLVPTFDFSVPPDQASDGPPLKPIRKDSLPPNKSNVNRPQLSLQTSHTILPPLPPLPHFLPAPSQSSKRKSYADDTMSIMTTLSPLPSDIPIVPSPVTAQRRRMSKLRRHLGETTIPTDVYLKTSKIKWKPRIRYAKRSASKEHLEPFVVKVDEPCTSSDESPGNGEGGDVFNEVQVTVNLPSAGRYTSQTVNVNRWSRQWAVEKGGRKVDENYQDVLRRLRAL